MRMIRSGEGKTPTREGKQEIQFNSVRNTVAIADFNICVLNSAKNTFAIADVSVLLCSSLFSLVFSLNLVCLIYCLLAHPFVLASSFLPPAERAAAVDRFWEGYREKKGPHKSQRIA